MRGLDIMILRELTGGIYFGEPRGIETLPDGQRRGTNTQVYTTHEIIRIARVGFELARKRQGRVCSVEKANVMESGVLWREEVQKLRDAEYEDIELSHMYADNCAMQLVRQPKQFDVILSDNLFGDILLDCAAMLTGLLGMLPSASLGAPGLMASARRCTSRCTVGAGHRRPRAGEPDRDAAELLDDAPLLVRAGRGRGHTGSGDRQGARGRPAHRRHHAGRHGQGLDLDHGRGDRARAGQDGGMRSGPTRPLVPGTEPLMYAAVSFDVRSLQLLLR